jgi:hypothetical protein
MTVEHSTPVMMSSAEKKKLFYYGQKTIGVLRVRFPAGAGDFCLHHCVQNGSGAHPTSYPMGTRGSFPGGKASGA